MITLSLGGVTHSRLYRHLFPGDGYETAAILLCSRTPGPRLRLVVRDAILVSHAECARRGPDFITWPGRWIEAAIDAAEPDNLALVLIHSHPGGLFDFSDVDNASDQRVIPGLFQALGDLHGSAIMTPDGAIHARLYTADMKCSQVNLVSIAGDDISYWWSDVVHHCASQGRPMAFTRGMSLELGRLRAAVIGVSGTGSIVIEQISRLGFGEIIMIDFDRIESRNLNRILNSGLSDVATERLKVEMMVDAIAHHRGAGVAVPVKVSVATREAVLAASQADVLFCCVDTLEARHIADLIAAAFLLPLFDVGVVIPVRREGEGVAIADACGRVDYVQPGGATLQDRGVYSPVSLRAEYLQRVSPEAHQDELNAGYIKGLIEEAPSVITLNMRAAVACVNEFVARAYPFRHEPNRLYSRTEFSLAACEEDYTSEDDFSVAVNPIFGRGGTEPLLMMPFLKNQDKEST